VKLIGFIDYRKVKALRSGSATTDAGGTVTITRIIAFKDGSKETEKWTHKYPKPPDDHDDRGGDDGGGGGGGGPTPN